MINKSLVFCKNRPLLLAKLGISVYNKIICEIPGSKGLTPRVLAH